MKKITRIIALAVTCFLTQINYAQVGIGTTTPNTSAMLEIESTDSGILIPRMNQAQRDAITVNATTTGLLIYQTNNTPGFYYYNGASWVTFGGAADNDWTVSGNDIYNANTNNVGVGTPTPTHKFTVKHDVANAGVMCIENNNSAGFLGIYFSEGPFSATNYRGHVGHVNSTSGFAEPGTFQVASGDRDLVFSATDGSNSFEERIRIKKTGEVRIGPTATVPTHRLHVHNETTDDVLRLQGPDAVGSGARLNFGDGNFVYLDEDVDDHLIIEASGGVQVTADLDVTGTLSKGGGTFKIDHPLDPANKYLYHSFVESPDMMNIYNGNITTNSNGVAKVKMPKYFKALNKEFRYQLTVIGSFAQAIISKELNNNSFEIKTNNPNVKVSWMVTGVRKDAWANENRVIPEVKKTWEKGHYIHPKLHGAPESKNITKAKRPTIKK